jgi:hypothetical protein
MGCSTPVPPAYGVPVNAPTLEVDTTDGWHPDLEEIAAFCRHPKRLSPVTTSVAQLVVANATPASRG